MHSSSIDKMGKFCNEYLNKNEKLTILDLGSQDVNGTYKEIFINDNWTYLGCDMCEGKNVDLVLNNPYNWIEIEPNSMDVIISGQTFEHIEYIFNTIIEISNALKEGGLCCLIAPSIFPEHKYPTDCWRIFGDGFITLARFAGLEVLNTYTDKHTGNEYYRETVLICKKPFLDDVEKEKFKTKTNLVRSLLIDYDIKLPSNKN